MVLGVKLIRSPTSKNILEIDWDKVVVGDVVMIKTLNQKVTILSLPDKNKRLFVDMGAMKMKVKKMN